MSETHANLEANNGDGNDTAVVIEPLGSNSVVNQTTAVNGPGNTPNLATSQDTNSSSPMPPSTPRSAFDGSTTPDTGSVSDNHSIWSSGASNRWETDAKSVDPRAPPFIPREVPSNISAEILINPSHEVILGRYIQPAPILKVHIPVSGFPRGTSPALSVFIGNESRLLSPRLVSGTHPPPLIKVDNTFDGCLYYKFDRLKVEGTAPEGPFTIRFMFYIQRAVGFDLGVGEMRSRVQTSTPFHILATESGRPTPMLSKFV